MEDQDYDSILKNCEGPWKDDVFPPLNRSICPPQEWKEDPYSSYEWVRASKIPSLTNEDGDCEIFTIDPSPSDINQGKLDDSYFLSAVSVIAQKGDRIKNIFKS